MISFLFPFFFSSPVSVPSRVCRIEYIGRDKSARWLHCFKSNELYRCNFSFELIVADKITGDPCLSKPRVVNLGIN